MNDIIERMVSKLQLGVQTMEDRIGREVKRQIKRKQNSLRGGSSGKSDPDPFNADNRYVFLRNIQLFVSATLPTNLKLAS